MHHETQEPDWAKWPRLMPLVGFVVLIGVLVLPDWTGSADVGDQRVRWTIRIALCFYVLALSLMLLLNKSQWSAVSGRGRAARWSWTFAWAAYLVHVAMAFHYYHQWSHDHAFEHTRSESGLGEGIYFSHLFTLLWTTDVAWWWRRPAAYAERRPIYGRLLHGFMLFIVFNGTIVYEQGFIRWAGIAGFGWLCICWYLTRMRRRSGLSPLAQ